jgi:hypothetical protein
MAALLGECATDPDLDEKFWAEFAETSATVAEVNTLFSGRLWRWTRPAKVASQGIFGQADKSRRRDQALVGTDCPTHPARSSTGR